MKLGKFIKEARKNKGWSREKLGEMVKIDPKIIESYEKNRMLPGLHELENLQNILEADFGNIARRITVDVMDYTIKNTNLKQGQRVRHKHWGEGIIVGFGAFSGNPIIFFFERATDIRCHGIIYTEISSVERLKSPCKSLRKKCDE